jgi:hypothetical protein
MTDQSIAAQARAMTPFEKFDAGASLFEKACAWSMAGIAAVIPIKECEDLMQDIFPQQ